MKSLSKALLLATLSGVTMSGFSHWGWFNSNYDPYYGYYNSCGCRHHNHTCYRPNIQSVNHRCTCVRNVDTCQRVKSVSTFNRCEMKRPKYQKMCKLHVNVFRGMY